MATILLTGITGAVGSSLAPLLKKRGHELICLVRGSNPAIRLGKIHGDINNSIILNGDITLPNLGICNLEMQHWRGKIDEVFHCASSVKFDEALANETTFVNIHGTQNVLDFAKDMKIPEVHYVSTAYVAGDAEVFSEHDMDIGQKCRNVYERTKLEAEKLVKNWKFGNHSIYRLGIVVGDTVTGYTPSFNGFYVFASRYWQLKQMLACKRADLGENKANEICFKPNGILSLPVWARFSPESTLNIVPIDWASEMLAKLAGIPADGHVFHVVHPEPPKVLWLNDVSLRHLGITDFRYGIPPDSHGSKSLLGKLQKILDRGIAPYIPYIDHEAKFEVSNLPRVLGRDYVPPHIVDEPLIGKWLDYAISAGFGRV
jgi:dTDP-4-dehydrorhamnose reductase